MAEIPGQCAWITCGNKGVLGCTRCEGATPPTLYCSRQCRKHDWYVHKYFCGRKAYTFDLTLVGSSNPVIKRTFDIPAWWTFRQFHYVLQYAMGPWQCTHLHEFTFTKPREQRPGEPFRFEYPDDRLNIGPEELYEDDDFEFTMPGMPPRPKVPQELEQDVRLEDVFDPAGKLYNIVAPQGEVYPLKYVYDMGDDWEHELIFKGQKLARADRPLFSLVQGCGPVEDCHGPYGWNEIKAAFSTQENARTSRQKFLLKWAGDVSEQGSEFDALKERDMEKMNWASTWERHLMYYMEMSDQPLEEMFEDSDEFDEYESE